MFSLEWNKFPCDSYLNWWYLRIVALEWSFIGKISYLFHLDKWMVLFRRIHSSFWCRLKWSPESRMTTLILPYSIFYHEVKISKLDLFGYEHGLVTKRRLRPPPDVRKQPFLSSARFYYFNRIRYIFLAVLNGKTANQPKIKSIIILIYLGQQNA